MAKFVFRLQSVLNLKISLENQQKNVFAAARKRLNDEEEKLEILLGRLAEYEKEGRKLRSKSLFIRDILDNQNAISTMKDYIEDQRAQVRLAEKILENERVKLVEMIKERKTYERLREKAFDEYLESEKHSEDVENDEHNSYVYGVKEA